MYKLKYSALFALLLLPVHAIAQEGIENGTYDAVVTTSSGSYTVPVEVEDGEVTHVEWPNGGHMSVDGGELDGEYASGTNSRGDYIDIEIEE